MKITEKALQIAVLELAETLKWSSYHTYDSRRSNPGFPDLVLWRERVIFAELKSSTGKLSIVQANVGAELLLAGAEWYEWNPEHWLSGEIEEVLRRVKA